MAENLPSEASEIAGGKKPAADSTHNQSQTNPKKEAKPRQRKSSRKWLGLSKSKWRELLGIFLLIPWVWNEIIDTRGFLKLLLLAVCLATAQGIVFSFWGLSKKTILAWTVSLMPVFVIVWLNCRPESKPYPVLKIGVATSKYHSLWLTNDFLDIKPQVTSENWVTTLSLSNGSPWLEVPSFGMDKTNVSLVFLLSNGKEAAAEDAGISVSIGTKSVFTKDTDWVRHDNIDDNGANFGSVDFDFKIDFIPINHSVSLPPLTFSCPLPNDHWGMQRAPVVVVVRAKNAPDKLMRFWLITAPAPEESTNLLKTRIFSGNQVNFNTNGFMTFIYSKDQIQDTN